jgi:PD-(D/E)XK nuclease superfamily protein
MTYSVSQSKIKCWRECRKKFEYRYTQEIERKRIPQPLVRGRIIHNMIEAALKGKNPWDAWRAAKKLYAKLFREEQEEYGDLIGDLQRLMTGYFDWYKRDPIQPILVKGQRAEIEFEVKLMPEINLKGKIDQFGRTKDGRKWLIDHKSVKQLPEGDIVYSDIQTVLYVWADLTPVNGIAYNYIRAKGPTVPEVLKSGEMSRRAIDTLWPVYNQALIDAKLDPRDYDDMREKLRGKESEFFTRVYLPVNPHITNQLLAEARVTASEIHNHKQKDIVRTPGRHCKWCEYYNLCNAELRGLDADYMRKKEYQEKKDGLEETGEAAERP